MWLMYSKKTTTQYGTHLGRSRIGRVTKIPTHDDIYPGHLIKGAGKMEGLLGYG